MKHSHIGYNTWDTTKVACEKLYYELQKRGSYVDRFGFAEINKVVRKIFRYAYQIRLIHYSVQLPTIDNSATSGIMFKTIRDAQSPYDIINLMTPQIGSLASNADSQIKQLYF